MIGSTTSTAQACADPFRLFTDGPKLLMEGNTVHRRLSERPRPLGRLLGTGGPIRLTDVPYNPSRDILLATHAIDFGAVSYYQSDGDKPRIELHRAMPPRSGHQLVLWSNRTVDDGGWVNLMEPIIVRAEKAFIAVPEPAREQ